VVLARFRFLLLVFVRLALVANTRNLPTRTIAIFAQQEPLVTQELRLARAVHRVLIPTPRALQLACQHRLAITWPWLVRKPPLLALLVSILARQATRHA